MTNEITPEQVEQAEGLELCRYVELLVFGDDGTANTPHRLSDALLSAPEYDLTEGEERWLVKNGADPDAFPWYMEVWKHRGDLIKETRDLLESHVSAWRAEPRDFLNSGDAERELKAELLKRFKGLLFQSFYDKCGNLYCSCDIGHFVSKGFGEAESEARALCIAACKACLKQRKES